MQLTLTNQSTYIFLAQALQLINYKNTGDKRRANPECIIYKNWSHENNN